MKVKAIKQYLSVQWDGANENELQEFCKFKDYTLSSDLQITFFSKVGTLNSKLLVMELGDWVVYSPYKNKYKVYTDAEFVGEFIVDRIYNKGEDKFFTELASDWIKD